MKNILKELKGGDLRSIGKSNEITKIVLDNPKLFKDIITGMTNSDPIVRMRSADIAEKVSKLHPEYLQPYKKQLINNLVEIPQKEVRWHLAQMFSYLSLTPMEISEVARILFFWTENEKSNIVRVMSLQTLVDVSEKNKKIRNKVLLLLEKFMKNGTPSLKSRSKIILKKLNS